VATGTFIDVQSKYKYCGSTAEYDLDIAIGVQPAKRGEHPALSDPVLVAGSIALMGALQALDAADLQSFTSPRSNQNRGKVEV
jgi:hypothetical protein